MPLVDEFEVFLTPEKVFPFTNNILKVSITIVCLETPSKQPLPVTPYIDFG